MQWIEIKRDKNGFATEECLNEMFKHEMFVVRDKYEILGYEGYFLCTNPGLRGEIYRDKNYTHYVPIPKLQL
jgi:hypothetical protein